MIQIRFWVGTFQPPLSPRQRTPLFHLSALYTSFRRFSTPLTSFSSDGIMVPRQGSPFGLRGSKCFDPSPDVGHATVGSRSGSLARRAPMRVPAVFNSFVKGVCAERIAAPRKTGSGPRGSALGPGQTSSDGKPCSGVRGGQEASTEFPQAVFPPVTLLCKGKTLLVKTFSPCGSCLMQRSFL